MSLSPFFSLSALQPYISTYDAANPTEPYANAFLYTYGGLTRHYGALPLQSQYDSNAIVLGYDPSTPGTGLYQETEPWKRNGINIYFTGHNVTNQNQYLLIFDIRRIQGAPSVEFFVGLNLVDTKVLEPYQYDTQAILVDCPGDGLPVNIWARLASLQDWSMASFHGLDCHKIK